MEIISPGIKAPFLKRSSPNTIGLIVQRCHSLIKNFSDRTSRHMKSLLVGEPGNNPWDLWWDVNWRLLAITDLREQLVQQKTAIILVFSLSLSYVLQSSSIRTALISRDL